MPPAFPSEAHDALGMVYMRDGKWTQSEASFRRAIELDRSNSGAYNDFSSWLLLPLGRIDEAVHQLRRAEKADPLSPFIQQRLAGMLILAGRFEEAFAHCGGELECLARVRIGARKNRSGYPDSHRFQQRPRKRA